MPISCPLCEKKESLQIYHVDTRRTYYECSFCHVICVDPTCYLSESEEKAVYDMHQNSPDDAGYRLFLSRLTTPLLGLISPHSRGLDFGSGPGPTLSIMLEEKGHQVALFDKFYCANDQVWNETYDFITATEVIEHLVQPLLELRRLWSHLNKGGILAIMTKRAKNKAAFSRWHYKNDPTHILFLTDASVAWIAECFNAQLILHGDDVFFLRK